MVAANLPRRAHLPNRASGCVADFDAEAGKSISKLVGKPVINVPGCPPIAEVITSSGVPQLALVPSNLGMSTVDLALMPMAGREFKLRNALREVEAHYDFIIFDAPPSAYLARAHRIVRTATQPSRVDVLVLAR